MDFWPLRLNSYLNKVTFKRLLIRFHLDFKENRTTGMDVGCEIVFCSVGIFVPNFAPQCLE